MDYLTNEIIEGLFSTYGGVDNWVTFYKCLDEDPLITLLKMLIIVDCRVQPTD